MCLTNDDPLHTAREIPRPARKPTTLVGEVEQPVIPLLGGGITISCHCNRVNEIIKALPARAFTRNKYVDIDINHDYRARRFSGQLAVSYFPSLRPKPSTLAKTACFRLGGLDLHSKTTLYFCPVCGCHLFKEELDMVAEKFRPTWAVATGVAEKTPHSIPAFGISQHINVDQTGDGGLSVWMRAGRNGSIIPTDTLPPDDYAPWSPTLLIGNSLGLAGADTLDASCFCGTVKFHITRPNHESTLPKSQYPDLMIPYYTNSQEIPNLDDEKWWIRGNRYLAGTCACTSCRKCSGFDIQSWAFIPRANIFMHDSDKAPGLDFSNLPEGILRSYSSSPGVTREFCPGCGATVFWHNTDRPELIDVSVGLFSAKGARAEDWLDWWKKRVSFSEDRYGSHRLVWDPVTCLEAGLRGVPRARM
ncbi:hypothetical protein V494_01731 [Pseudogymnoascus sp. VKM F-4513 (FW-928)]|nr:hypothetical protein V494_01731 [Pseudogymnoascus sp. VKM F-4513 (FW-928)]